jgi:hypothetical protein
MMGSGQAHRDEQKPLRRNKVRQYSCKRDQPLRIPEQVIGSASERTLCYLQRLQLCPIGLLLSVKPTKQLLDHAHPYGISPA